MHYALLHVKSNKPYYYLSQLFCHILPIAWFYVIQDSLNFSPILQRCTFRYWIINIIIAKWYWLVGKWNSYGSIFENFKSIKTYLSESFKIMLHYSKDSTRFRLIEKGMYRHWCEKHSSSKRTIFFLPVINLACNMMK